MANPTHNAPAAAQSAAASADTALDPEGIGYPARVGAAQQVTDGGVVAPGDRVAHCQHRHARDPT